MKKKTSSFRTKSHARGFSLIETLAVISILGILAGFAGLSFMNLSPKYKLITAVWEINSRLHYARHKALFEATKVRLTFGTQSYAVEIFNESHNAWEKELPQYLEGVSLQANNTPTFHPGGTVSNLASIMISNKWGAYKITIAISGRIKALKL